MPAPSGWPRRPSGTGARGACAPCPCIAPGWFPSEMTNTWFAVPAFLDRFKTQAPMARIGEEHELDGPLLFLASDASSFVTGQTLAVDGGLSAVSGNMPITDEQYAIFAAVAPGLGERILPEA